MQGLRVTCADLEPEDAEWLAWANGRLTQAQRTQLRRVAAALWGKGK